MQITLLSNIPHYHHLATALYGAGLLRRYITSIALLEGDRAPQWLNAHLARKLEGRRLNRLPKSCVTRIRMPEVAQRMLPMTGLLSSERANWLNNVWFDRTAAKYVAGCDVLHFVSSIGLYSARRAKRQGATVVCDVREDHPAAQRHVLSEEYKRFGIRVEPAGRTFEPRVLEEFELADRIIVPSKRTLKTFTEQGLSRHRFSVIPYGVDLTDFKRAERRDGAFRILYAGTITIRKGVQYLLEAFSRLRAKDARLTLIGTLDPVMRPILARYEGQFEYRPAVPRLDLCRWYAHSSVFVQPSLGDSFSLATLEAMACGTPAVVSDHTGVADCIENGRNGYVVPAGSADSLLEQLMELYEDRSRIDVLGSAAAAAARQYTWERYGEASVSAYLSAHLQGHTTGV